MILVDTSVWIPVLKDKTGKIVHAFRERIAKIRPLANEFFDPSTKK
ncbi:MAG: hypothetical protein ACMUJM_23630 [bacterium]